MSSRDRAGRWITAAIVVALVLLALRTGSELWRFATTAPELPLWDEAKYGLDGARLAAALADFDLPRFTALVYDLDVWPPVFPGAESLVFLAAGNGFAVARGFVAVLFVALVLATAWAAREIAPECPAVAVVAAGFVLASPFTQLFGVQAMLEVPGAFLYVVCLAAYARHLRTGTRASLVATGLLSAALFFTKYNYGLLWLAALAVSEVWIACGSPRAVLDRALVLARRFDLRRPFTLFVVVYLLVLVTILLTGGGTLRLGGRALSVRSIGNPLLVLVVIVLGRAVWRPRLAWNRFLSWERSLARRHRVLLWTVAAPAVVWLLLPPHLRSFVDFVENRSSGPSLLSAESVLFYPRAFAVEYHPWTAIGVGALVAALTAVLRITRVVPAARALLLAVAVALAALTLHPYKQPRFLLIAAPALWLAAAWNVATVAEMALERARVKRWSTNVALALIVIVVLALRAPISPTLPGVFARYTVPASAGPMIDRVIDLVEERTTLLLGTWNQASPALFEWRSLQRDSSTSGATGAAIALDVVVPGRHAGGAEKVLRRLRGPSPPQQIVILDVDARTAPSPEWATAFATETEWLAPVRRELESGAAGYFPVRVRSFSAPGYRVGVYRARR